MRYDPRKLESDENPLSLDSKKPSINYDEFTRHETRFSMLKRSHPEHADRFQQKAQKEVDERWLHYAQLAKLDYGLKNDDEGTSTQEKN